MKMSVNINGEWSRYPSFCLRPHQSHIYTIVKAFRDLKSLLSRPIERSTITLSYLIRAWLLAHVLIIRSNLAKAESTTGASNPRLSRRTWWACFSATKKSARVTWVRIPGWMVNRGDTSILQPQVCLMSVLRINLADLGHDILGIETVNSSFSPHKEWGQGWISWPIRIEITLRSQYTQIHNSCSFPCCLAPPTMFLSLRGEYCIQICKNMSEYVKSRRS